MEPSTLIAVTDRDTLMGLIPPGGIGAEIGVYSGAFSRVILERASPSRLHLIDPWSHNESDEPNADARALAESRRPNAQWVLPSPNDCGERQFLEVMDVFKNDPRVQLHRQFSYREVNAFPDEYFDFIYIDGNHGYEFVLRDLLDYAPKVKANGVILGHDFFHNPFAVEENYGVMPAVRTFLRRKAYHFLVLTTDEFSSFVLTKEIGGGSSQFLENLTMSDIPLVRLPTELTFSYYDSWIGGGRRRIPAFGVYPSHPRP